MVDDLAKTMALGALLAKLGSYELLDHGQQGELHHDVVLRARGRVLVVATNCNEFTGELPPIRERAVTEHWFDPCALLTDDARSVLLPEPRARMRGGGWCAR
jgi:hypothetical protein